MNQSGRNIKDDYIFKSPIGKGAYGEVFKASHRRTKDKVAIKVISKNTQRFRLKRFQKERDIIKSFDHPNIMGYIDCYEDDDYYYIVSEYIKHGELFNYVISNNIPIKKCKKIFCQLLSAVEYCHGNLVAHRDIKLENIMISDVKNFTIKLIDFGFATKLNLHSMHKKKCGSPEYAAPELLYSDKYNPFKSDIWSLGVVLFSLVTGSFPFPSPITKRPYTYDTATKQYSVIQYCKSAITDPLLNDLLSKIFVLPENRISIHEIKNHLWLNGFTVKSYLPTIPLVSKGLLLSKSDLSDSKEVPKGLLLSKYVVEKMVELGFNRTEVMKSLVNKTKTVELVVYYHLSIQDSAMRLSDGFSEDPTLGFEVVNTTPDHKSKYGANDTNEQLNNLTISEKQSLLISDHPPVHQKSDSGSTENVNSGLDKNDIKKNNIKKNDIKKNDIKTVTQSPRGKRKFIEKNKYCKFMVDITMEYLPMVGIYQKVSNF
ncbi:hypothetical protein QJ857_gp0295 [Tupanvirus soda lake]|uniref:Ankyrin repeat protein n=1 Tax=Tupanvirus deep ocean TaxID=2126984 RepID=A0A2K9L5Y0_9VIRU|nr:hypothetical protein QJ857_gp0295 [Tupanvirus soda lake]AUL78591.2 hypothetical protein [Tupanvirus soda lake]